jgi:hypothetical protein
LIDVQKLIPGRVAFFLLAHGLARLAGL